VYICDKWRRGCYIVFRPPPFKISGYATGWKTQPKHLGTISTKPASQLFVCRPTAVGCSQTVYSSTRLVKLTQQLASAVTSSLRLCVPFTLTWFKPRFSAVLQPQKTANIPLRRSRRNRIWLQSKRKHSTRQSQPDADENISKTADNLGLNRVSGKAL